MTIPGCSGRIASDPIGLITDLVAAVECQLTREQIQAVAADVVGGRAKSRRLASALAERPAVLADGRSPAPRAVGDLLVALRRALAQTVSPPWLRHDAASSCGPSSAAARTGTARSASSGRNRALRAGRSGRSSPGTCSRAPAMRQVPGGGRPRPGNRDLRHQNHRAGTLMASRDAVAAAVRRWAPRPSSPAETGLGIGGQPPVADRGGPSGAVAGAIRGSSKNCAIPEASRGIVRPALPRLSPGGAHRQAAWRRAGLPDLYRHHSRIEECARCASRAAKPVTRDDQGRPGLRELFHHRPGESGGPASAAGAAAGSNGGPRTGRYVRALPHAACADVLHLRPDRTVRHLPASPACLVPGLPAADGSAARPAAASCRSPPARWPGPLCARSAPAPARPGPLPRSAATPGHPSPGHCSRCLISRAPG